MTHRSFGKFESLESRSLLSAAPTSFSNVCLVPGEHTTAAGEIFFIDDLSSYPEENLASLAAKYESASPIGLDRVPIFHSDPTASQKIYLDFNGQVVSGTGWNELNQGRTIHAGPFDMDGKPGSFNGTEQAVIEEVWARVAEDFAPFEIDVTTESPSARSFRQGSQAIRVLISSNVDQLSGEAWMHAGNGVAFLNSWRHTTDTPVWVFSNRLGGSGKRIAESVSHEVGHTFGLHHDGLHHHDGEDEEYFAGHGDLDGGWAPIMGLGYHRTVTQWDQGEYHGANNHEHDLEVITSPQNGVSLRADDHPDQLIFATALSAHWHSDTGIAEFHGEGLISDRHDQDSFLLKTAAGTLDLFVAPAAVGANLNLSVTVFDSHGRAIRSVESHDVLPVRIELPVEADFYFVRIDGVGQGDHATDGYSDYGSIGRYSLEAQNFPEMDALRRVRTAAKRLLADS